MTVLYLDPYFLGDALFLGGFARDLAARPPGAPLVVVHGSGEAGERAVEALGEPAVAERGVWAVRSPAARAAVVRAARELGRSVVHELGEAGVAGVRVAGLDRGLLTWDGAALRAGRTDWLRTLAEQGGVPVVAALAARDGTAEDADPATAAAVLARALGADAVTALLTGRAPHVEDPDGRVARLPADALGTVRGVPDADALRRILAAGADVRLTSLAGLRRPAERLGTLVSGRLDG